MLLDTFVNFVLHTLIVGVVAWTLFHFSRRIHGGWPSLVALAVGGTLGLAIALAIEYWDYSTGDIFVDELWFFGAMLGYDRVPAVTVAGMFASWISLRCFGRRITAKARPPS